MQETAISWSLGSVLKSARNQLKYGGDFNPPKTKLTERDRSVRQMATRSIFYRRHLEVSQMPVSYYGPVPTSFLQICFPLFCLFKFYPIF